MVGCVRTWAGNKIRKYFSERFGMTYVSIADLEKDVSGEEVQQLTEVLKELRPNTRLELIENDAKMALAIYGKRENLGERYKANPYGYRTWWLTQETIVRKATITLVDNKGAQYIMRPEFLLNFIALSPTMSEVRNAYKDVFPTLLGVKLGNRMRPDLFHGIMEKAREAMGVDDARARVMMEDYSNKLKGDYFKEYEVELGVQRTRQRPVRWLVDCPSPHFSVRRGRRVLSVGEIPTRATVVPAGSNWDGRGGDEAAEASNVEGPSGTWRVCRP